MVGRCVRDGTLLDFKVEVSVVGELPECVGNQQ